jgi:minor extracellular serine protease Vpr
MLRAVSALFLLVVAASGQPHGHMADYALLLADAPVARSSQSRFNLRSPQAQARVQALRKAQSSVLAELARRKVAVRGTAQVLLNAIFVTTTRDAAAQLLAIPGVVHVVHVPRLKRDLDQALGLERVPEAWTVVGGPANAGAGIKIGIIDTGIDQNHPGFIDPTLTPPPGIPTSISSFINSKVIVARSYVKFDTDPDHPDNPDPTISTPDDYSPRDHVGHGTAIAMIAAGVQNTGPLATIQGVAPKAFLGNYKVFGSPGVNDYASAAGLQQALTDAIADGMDIVTLSLSEGNMPDYGPLDVDPTCSSDQVTPAVCDVYGQMVTNAVTAGLVVVTSAGNDGDLSLPHTLSTVHTPGTTPAAITVGASYNAHLLYQSVTVSPARGSNALLSVQALYSDGPQLALPPLRIVDVATLQNDGLACSPLPANSLLSDIALIQRGTCPFSDKIVNAQNAGALGVILYLQDGEPIFPPTGTNDTGIPAVMISNTDGVNLRNISHSTSGPTVALNPAFTPAPNPPNSIWPSSSRGPSIGTFTPGQYQTFVIKPELVAVGAGIYTATQKYDPSGDTYNATGYAGVSGTSYAVPMVAGAVAMVKQMRPQWKPAQLKSAVVNSAAPGVTDTDGTVAGVDAVGAGKLDAYAALNVAATVDPATIEFGALTSANFSTSSITLTVTNVFSTQATFSIQPSTGTVSVSPGTLTLQPGGAGQVTVTPKGSLPAPGSYEGFITVSGPGDHVSRVPYQFLVGSGVVADVFPVYDGGFIAPPNDTNWPIQPRAIDQYGVPVIGQSVLFSAGPGGGSVVTADTTTFRYGVATGTVNLGPQLGTQVFNATIGGLVTEFDGYARPLPAINTGGVMDGASFSTSRGLAPGSYITIKGTALADATQVFSTGYLPVSLSAVSVSFDGGGKSLPGHLHFVSPGQINVQVPWEFQGQTSVSLKVSLSRAEYLQSAVYTVTLADLCPYFFERSGIVAAVDFTTRTVVDPGSPVAAGDIVELYANGLGPVTNQSSVLDGQPSPSSPFAQTPNLPTVTIGGVNAPVSFSGLAPGIVGLYQVNVTVPAGVPSGMQPVVLSIGGLSTQTSQLPVK